ncbi:MULTISPECIES: class I SAM-dependent methyltransferase [unclassified Achromobacter]|uniref:class I SAM-dependent methyltransferase n=1 Tax=unclassified Achromobacter TaxID=2626865 RepID=UPI0011787D53|nr:MULTISPECIES: class I SAM-dependent methyltransferase [unclassified Achromobacter]
MQEQPDTSAPPSPPYQPVVLSILHRRACREILDAPCGFGWLGQTFKGQATDSIHIDGVGMWEFPSRYSGYRDVREHDLDHPLPAMGPSYDAVVCGEALHLLCNPGVALESFRKQLRPGGTLIVTTPNTWYMRSRLQYLLRGFHSGFAPAVGKRRGEYIPFIPWSFTQLHLMLSRYGYTDITLHDVDEPKPKRMVEYALAVPGLMYIRRKKQRAGCDEERRYWEQAGSRQSMYGRWLVVSARAPAES